MKFVKLGRSAGALACVGVMGCGGAKASDDDDWTPPPSTLVERTFLEDGRYEEQLDIDLDDDVDTIVRYRLFGDDGRPVEARDEAMRMSLESRRQVEKEIDNNGDGTMDTFRYYALSGALEREERDANFDGAIEYVATYADGELVKVELDEDVDGVSETVRFYRDGALFRVEVDSDGNAVADNYYYYGEDGLERRGIDANEDGAIEDWVRRPLSSTPTAAPSPPSPDAGGDADADASESEE